MTNKLWFYPSLEPPTAVSGAAELLQKLNPTVAMAEQGHTQSLVKLEIGHFGDPFEL